MKTETITRIKLTADEGMILTNGDIYGREIYLATGDPAENYYEITEKEYNEIQDKLDTEANR